jgi:cycloeucalenol cycloisomerase
MYTVGSLFYAIYFFVSFPAFFVMDEGLRKCSLERAATDSLAAGMLVTILLDFWRLVIGPFDQGPFDAFLDAGKMKLPWLK